ncbi:MAG: hypothetical protein A2Y17_03015 [Clostridiales bacterium GWF2_38_85]|nr:MAG: hypothetical protein A2Y17_03015 [Clostridiales bacterium GWF2_38_85]
MINDNIGLTPAESIELMAEKQKGDLKITLLEKHLMNQREMYNQLKEEENESLKKQETIVTEIYKFTKDIKDYNEIAQNTIKEEAQRIKTELFDVWQISLKQVLDDEIKRVADLSFSETSKIIEKQNAIIDVQSKNIKSLVTGYKLMKFMSYAVMVVAIFVLAIIPIGQFGYIKLSSYFDKPDIWGGVILASTIVILVLSIILVVQLKKRIQK